MNNINYSLSLQLGELLMARELKLAVAESCTGGGLAAEITAVPGCSAYFDRGFVTYTDDAKHEQLDVPIDTLVQYGAVSSEVAAAMVEGLLKHSQADIGISITGIAGPGGGSKEKPVGLVWFGIGTRQGVYETYYANFGGGRKQVRRLAIGFAFELALNLILKRQLNLTAR